MSLEQQLSMKEKQMQTTKEEIRKIKGEIEEVRFLAQQIVNTDSLKVLIRVALSSGGEHALKL